MAEALDHTDLQNVRVYFDIKSDIVESLDRAMALKLGPVAQAFLGKLVPNEAGAERGDDPASRVMAVGPCHGPPGGPGHLRRLFLLRPARTHRLLHLQPIPALDGRSHRQDPG